MKSGHRLLCYGTPCLLRTGRYSLLRIKKGLYKSSKMAQGVLNLELLVPLIVDRILLAGAEGTEYFFTITSIFAVLLLILWGYSTAEGL